MDKSKKIAVFIVINIIIIILIVIVILLRLHQNKIKQKETVTYVEETELVDELRVVDVRNYYYSVQSCVNKYYSYYMTLFNAKEYYEDANSQEDIKEIEKNSANIIYNMLDKEYINTKKVQAENIKANLHEIKKSSVNITEMYESQKDSNNNIYVVKGFLANEKDGSTNQFQVIVKLDIANKVFSIIPQEYVEEKYNNLSAGNKIKINVNESITANKNNRFNYTFISNDVYIEDLFNKLKNELKYSTKLVYDDLDKDYKEKKFSNYTEFKNYVNDNSDRFSNMQLKGYQENQDNNYLQYILLDTNGNYYIINEIAPMKYTLILDTYTIDMPDFLNKYNSANDQEKMILNLNKFLLAINDKNYKYAYNLLADGFKTNNFPTLESFTKYIKSNFYNSNICNYIEFNKEAETYYTYKVDIKNKENNNDIAKTKTFIMQLGEGTDFKLSFDI